MAIYQNSLTQLHCVLLVFTVCGCFCLTVLNVLNTVKEKKFEAEEDELIFFFLEIVFDIYFNCLNHRKSPRVRNWLQPSGKDPKRTVLTSSPWSSERRRRRRG